jgi:hypothetical protein
MGNNSGMRKFLTISSFTLASLVASCDFNSSIFNRNHAETIPVHEDTFFNPIGRDKEDDGIYFSSKLGEELIYIKTDPSLNFGIEAGRTYSEIDSLEITKKSKVVFDSRDVYTITGIIIKR